MLYSLPKKIQMHVSQAKWRIESEKSVLVFVGLEHLKQKYKMNHNKADSNHPIFEHLTLLLKKAKALDIATIDLNSDQMMQGMMTLGEYLSQDYQLVIAGEISASFKQVIQHIASVSDHICIVDDAIDVENQEQHIQWINNCSEQGLHHVNTQTLLRLWSLSAPKELILSPKGILLALSEQLDMEALEIDPTVDLKSYGLDSVSMVSLIGLWRANGANITYEDFLGHCSLEKLMTILLI